MSTAFLEFHAEQLDAIYTDFFILVESWYQAKVPDLLEPYYSFMVNEDLVLTFEHDDEVSLTLKALLARWESGINQYFVNPAALLSLLGYLTMLLSPVDTPPADEKV